ncbi:MAG: hypothetical protein AAF299_15375, partial [Pseudomonadota bacterium]
PSRNMGGNGSKIVITGPPKAGKTTILHKLKLGKPVNETVCDRATVRNVRGCDAVSADNPHRGFMAS